MTNLHTSLTTDECIRRLLDELAESRQFSGLVEQKSFRLDRQRALPLPGLQDAHLAEPVLCGEFIPHQSGTSVQYDIGNSTEDAPVVEWRRLLLVLLPLLVGGVLLLLAFDITSRRDWFLALVFPALLILVIVARQAFAAYQARVAWREAVDFLRRILEAEDGLFES